MTGQAVDIVEACADPELFGGWFRDPSTWRGWFCFLRTLFGLPMGEADWALFQQCTGREDRPTGGFREAWLVVGRRGGKSIVLALIAVFLATFIDWTPYLSPGERGTVMVIATDRRQARVIFRYVQAFLSRVPMLAALIERETSDTIDLSNGVTIEILTANFRTVRGYTLIAALLDELAFWRSEESANPDTEILAAIRPAMASISGAMLLCASSPYARRGALWNAFKRHFGKPSPTLVWKADTRTMNPTISQGLIDEAIEDDPASAAAEYGAEFRVDVETYVPREVVEAAVVPGRYELGPISTVHYFAFVDPSGGTSDSMTLAIAHREKDGRAVLDAIRERRPPFSPEDVTSEFARLLKAFRVGKVVGDRYGGEWPRERFRLHGVTCELAEKPKSDIYRDILAALNSGRIELLDHPRLVTQICGLERRTARGGRDSIDHAPSAGCHDDLANSALAALLLVSTARQPMRIHPRMVELA
jgi:Phage Terminase